MLIAFSVMLDAVYFHSLQMLKKTWSIGSSSCYLSFGKST